MSSPVCRRPRSHAYACRCPRCVASVPRMKNGDYGILGPLALIAGVVAVTGFWPAMVWHGYTDTGGWRWDIHSTVAVAAYWGVIAFAAALAAIGNRPARHAVRPPRGPLNAEALPQSPPPPATRPACQHLHAEPLVNRFTAAPLAWFCAECDTQLPAEFGRLARSCCGTKPGGGHLYNCFHRKGVAS
jgi:hypothetical protein